MMKRLFSLLSILQVLSLLSVGVFILTLARLFHHQTESVFVDYWDYVSSFRIAFPPLLILIASYALGFLSGKKLSDLPASTISYLKNTYLQSIRKMAFGIAVIAIVCTAILSHTERTPPPHYENLVSAILAGEIDRSAAAKKLLQSVADQNPAFADQLSLVVETFELRRQINLEARVSDVVQSRLIIRTLSNASDTSWVEHPLRKHALAEAYSMFAQGIAQNSSQSLSSVFGTFEPNDLFSRSLSLYQEVRDNEDQRLVTPQLRYSASNNIGNIYLYQGDFQSALDSYVSTIEKHPASKSPGILANIIVAYIILGKYQDAIDFGENARIWAEENGKALQDTTHFVSILTNTGFAYLANGEVGKSASLFEFSALIVDDNDARLNIALSYAMGRKPRKAEAALRKVSEPVSYTSGKRSELMSAEKRCSYLIWALHDEKSDPRDVAARLFLFLGEHHTISELEKFSDLEALGVLRARVADWLPKFPGSCANLSAIPAIIEFIAGK